MIEALSQEVEIKTQKLIDQMLNNDIQCCFQSFMIVSNYQEWYKKSK